MPSQIQEHSNHAAVAEILASIQSVLIFHQGLAFGWCGLPIHGSNIQPYGLYDSINKPCLLHFKQASLVVTLQADTKETCRIIFLLYVYSFFTESDC